MSTTLFITSASSGIGACFLERVPEGIDRVVTFSRRQAPGEWFEADLADGASWIAVIAEMEKVLDAEGPENAIFFHCSGVMDPIQRVTDYAPSDYASMLMVNYASGASIGQGFLRACAQRGVRATLVLTSSPAAHKVTPGLSAYSASKLGLEHWGLCAASEQSAESGNRVFTVVPYAVLTDMVRGVMKEDPADVPLVNYFRDVEAADEFATPELTADHIWSAIGTAANGDILPVGAVWIAERNAAAAASGS